MQRVAIFPSHAILFMCTCLTFQLEAFSRSFPTQDIMPRTCERKAGVAKPDMV